MSRPPSVASISVHCPFMTPELRHWLSLDFSFVSFSCLGIFRGCPRPVPFHSFQFPLHVRVIFSVCPLHFPCVSLSFIASHFPTSPFVSSGFLLLCLPCSPPHSPCFHFFPLHVPSSSPSRPFQFPFVSLSFPLAFLPFCFLPSFPGTSCIFPSLPGIFPENNINTGFPTFSQKGYQTYRAFSRFSAKGGRKPEPAKSRQGIRALGPCFATPAPRRLCLVECHQQITAQYVKDPPFPSSALPPQTLAYQTWGGGCPLS